MFELIVVTNGAVSNFRVITHITRLKRCGPRMVVRPIWMFYGAFALETRLQK